MQKSDKWIRFCTTLSNVLLDLYISVNGWWSGVPILPNAMTLNTVPHIVGSPTIKLLLLLRHNCNFATTMNWNVNIWYLGCSVVLCDPRERVIWSPQRGRDPQFKNHCPRQHHQPFLVSVKKRNWPSLVVKICNPSSPDLEVERLWVKGQLPATKRWIQESREFKPTVWPCDWPIWIRSGQR